MARASGCVKAPPAAERVDGFSLGNQPSIAMAGDPGVKPQDMGLPSTPLSG
jgi:hypothetical protein